MIEIGVEYKLLHYPLGIEKRPVDGDGISHHVHEAAPVVVETGDNRILQLVVKRWGVL